MFGGRSAAQLRYTDNAPSFWHGLQEGKMAGVSDRDLFFNLYLLQTRFADNGAYSHTDLVRRSDGETMITDCWNDGAKNTEQQVQPDGADKPLAG
jgi:hypothetical protein